MLVIVAPLGVGGSKTMRTLTAAMMTEREARLVLYKPPPIAAKIAIITAIAAADVVVKDDLVFAFGTIMATLYVIPTPGWDVPLQPPHTFVVVIVVIIVSLQWPPSPCHC